VWTNELCDETLVASQFVTVAEMNAKQVSVVQHPKKKGATRLT
jgi:hypothetical protein